ncbi:MAG TPA: sugar ABC transporter ATP-binding protein [Terrimicrobiaceae bacterium]|nr:sugar ABC transporter ATP-binding protein [Terrimicrobiaceae bacterium]
MSATPPLLQLREITKSFQAVRALRGVSFDLRRGEVHALLGENGAGKSTLIKVITGAHQPDSGTIEIEGKPVTRLDPAASRALGIAAIYQQPALFPDLTVAENIALGLETPAALSRIHWRDRRTQAQQFLNRIGAGIDPDTEVRNLSMPEQQLVEIARSLGAGARVLIMDEPTASLTQKEVQLLYSVVRDLRTQGVGVVYISHRMEEIFALADRVTVLRDGQSIATQDTKGMNESTLIKLMVGREVSTLYPPSEASPGEVALSLRGVGCRESGVHDVNLELRAGEVIGFAGIVGAGRTELARVLFGITPADSGTISLRGKTVSIQSPREAVEHGIGYVPEDRRRHGVILDMPIAANITMSIQPTFFPGGWLRFGAERSLANGYIRELGVKTPSPDVPGGALSGGNQQKVSLARWLATKPKVLILDEPTQGVDVGAKSEIHKIIRRLTKEGLAVMMISSDLAEVLGMSDRIAVMHGGTIVREFPGKEATPHDVMVAALGQTGLNETNGSAA